jgi:SAM-dependent methyltransferase
MEIISPLTGTDNVTELEGFSVKRIIESYKVELGIDVERYFSGREIIYLYKCNTTGYRFYLPSSLAANGLFYEQLMAANKSYYPTWKSENEVALKFIKNGDELLDIGCGDGAFLNEVRNRLEVLAEGLEFTEAAAEKARAKGLTVYAESVERLSLRMKGKYDVVTSFQVVEHISQLKSFLSAKLNLLKPGGTMVIGVPFSNPYLYRKDKYHTLNLPPHHMGLWNVEAFRSLTRLFEIDICSIHIDRVDDISYYLSVNLGILGPYKSLMKKSKLIRIASRGFNKIAGPFFSFLKGRTIVVVFRKR